jgi:hypothetical protein
VLHADAEPRLGQQPVEGEHSLTGQSADADGEVVRRASIARNKRGVDCMQHGPDPNKSARTAVAVSGLPSICEGADELVLAADRRCTPALQVKGTGSFSCSGPVIEVPDGAPGFAAVVYLTAYVCPAASSWPATGAGALRAKVTVVDANPANPVPGQRQG